MSRVDENGRTAIVDNCLCKHCQYLRHQSGLDELKEPEPLATVNLIVALREQSALEIRLASRIIWPSDRFEAVDKAMVPAYEADRLERALFGGHIA